MTGQRGDYAVARTPSGRLEAFSDGVFAIAIDRPVLFANLALLLFVSALPFPTQLLAEYLTAGSDAHLAAAIYSGTMLAIGLAYSALWIAVTRDVGLLHKDIDPLASRTALRRFGLGNVVYLATIGLSFVSAIATLALHGALALYYCFDQLATTHANRRGDGAS